MKRYLFTIILLFGSLYLVNAQEWWDGNCCSIGSHSSSFTFQTTFDATVRGKNALNNEVIFTFRLDKEMRMTFSSRSISADTSNDTYIQLVGYSRDYLEYPFDDYFEKTLPPGTYNLSVTRFDSKKMVAINISGKCNDPFSTFFAGCYSDEFVYSDTKNTINYSNSYGLPGSDVLYNFTISKVFDININAKGLNSQKVQVYLLDSSRNLIVSSTGGIIYDDLPQGDYYIVVEGIDRDGEITTRIDGWYPCPENYYDVGTYNEPFTISQKEWLDAYPDILGNELGDIVLRFKLEVPMVVNVTHQGSAEQHTAIQLWDVEQKKIGDNVSDPSDISGINPNQATMRKYLQAGIYYIISESLEAYSDDFSRTIITTLEGINPEKPLADLTQNYICTRTMTNREGTTFVEKMQYFDGLGRPMENVQCKASPEGLDLITFQEYDSYGRESNSWLPRVGIDGSGNFISLNQFQELSPDIYDNDAKAYMTPIYEESPLKRITEQYGAGEDWRNHHKSVKTSLMTNIVGNDTLNCLLFKVDSEWENDTILTLRREGDYESRQLFVTRTEDEDGNLLFEFKDKLDRLVLSRQMVGNESLSTYYLYNAQGALLVVIPPKASELLVADAKTSWSSGNDTILQRYAYLYKYQPFREQLCRAKKLPGCAWTFYLYDRNNRLIFTQDGNMRQRGEWMFTLPDVSGRVCLTGICRNSFGALQDVQPIGNSLIIAERDNNAPFGYSIANNAIALVNPVILSANYFDDYSFMELNHFSGTDLAYNQEDGFDTRYYADNAVGLLTGSITAILEGASVNRYIPVLMYYDYRGRLIQTKSGSHLEHGVEKEYLSFNFVGAPVKRKHVHTAMGKTAETEVYTYTYDHTGRPLTTKHQLNEGPVIILSENTYDGLGRLKSTKRNNQSDLKVDYTYNIRSWTKSIRSPLFAQTLYYNDKRINNGTNTPSYTGNVSAMDWTTTDEKLRGYDFAYDNLSRLTSADYLEDNVRSSKFSTSYHYDQHGNMLSLTRRGNQNATTYGIIDNLEFTYSGNQLIKVEDTAISPSLSTSMDFANGSNQVIEYTYDVNGNQTKDLNKGIRHIEYNLLNLPRQITFSGTSNAVTEYVYSAGGTKLSVIHKSSTDNRTDYVGNMIYENGSLKRILVDGGYIEDGQYYFYLQDHLGNNRVVAKSDGTVVQTTHYYPYGMSFAEGTFADIQPYKYNGKELDMENGLNLYDYEARQMDGVLGRFTGIDPHTENYYSWSPYVYVGNNPLKYIDPTGKDWFLDQETGQLYFNKDLVDVSTTKYNDVEYSRIGGNNMMGEMEGVEEQSYDFETSTALANANGYSINPIQQVIHEKSINQKTQTGPNDVSITMGKTIIVNERYSVSPLEAKVQELDPTRRTEILYQERPGIKESIAFFMQNNTSVEFVTRRYTTYRNETSTDRNKNRAMNIFSGGNAVGRGVLDYTNAQVYTSWKSYSAATKGKGVLLEYQRK